MKWATAVKMWNMHGKIYNPRHVYAIPRKGTAEYLDVKHIQEHDELPTHLKKKGPFPPEALEQLRKHAEESTARREAAERKRLTEEIEKVRSPKLRIVEAEEEAPPIKVPALPERLEKKEKKKTTIEDVKELAKHSKISETINELIKIAKDKTKDEAVKRLANEEILFWQSIPKGYGGLLQEPLFQKVKKIALKHEVPAELIKEAKRKKAAEKRQSEKELTQIKLDGIKRREEETKRREDYDYAKYKKIWGEDDSKIKHFLASKGIMDAGDFYDAIESKSLPSSVPDHPDWVYGARFWSDYEMDQDLGIYKKGEAPQKKLTPAKAKVIAAILEEAKKRKAAATAKPDLSKFDAIKELGENGKEPKAGESKEKLKAQTQTVSIMKKRVLELLKEANKIEDFSKKIKASSHMEQELYKVEELLDLIKEAGGGKAIFEKKK